MVFDPAEVWSVASDGLVVDMLTCACINTASDTLAQATERFQSSSAASFDGARTQRLGSFGVADGGVSHVWFLALDGVVGEGQGMLETAVKTAADALVYTPLWCAWFLVAMALLEGRDLGSVPAIVRRDWLELFRGNLGFFLPLTSLIYGFVPREGRVLAFGVASLVYTTILSLWNSARVPESAELELCAVDDPDPACEPLPRPTRAVLLPMRARRVLADARRRVRSSLDRESE